MFVQDQCHKHVTSGWCYVRKATLSVDSSDFFHNLMGLPMHMWPVVGEIFVVLAMLLCLAGLDFLTEPKVPTMQYVYVFFMHPINISLRAAVKGFCTCN